MNLLKLSLHYQYLYSPVSFIHRIKYNYKIFYFFLQLLFVPYLSWNSTLLIIFTNILIFVSINIPKKEYQYLKILNGCLGILCFLLYFAQFVFIHNNIVDFCLHKFLSLPINKLIGVCIAYFYIIKLCLLTTHYEIVISKFFSNKIIINKIFSTQIYFMIILSSQFIQITLNQLHKKQIAYLIRGKKHLAFYKNTQIFNIYKLLLVVFIKSIYQHVNFINHSLYSRDIVWSELYCLNIYY